MLDTAWNAALDSIIMSLSDPQLRALRTSLARTNRLPIKVIASDRTTTTLVTRLLAWEPGTTRHRAELTELGRLVAERLEERTHGGEAPDGPALGAVGGGGEVHVP